MKRSKFTEEQIAFALRQVETGNRVEEVCRQMGISQATFFNWKKKFSCLSVSELRCLRQLEEENFQLKKLVADLSLDKQMLQDVKKNAVRPRKKRELVMYFHAYRVSARRACNALQLSRASWFYRSHRRDSQLLTMRMREIAFTRVRYGYRRILTLLRREGFKDNHKRVYRIYRQDGLNLRMKRPRRSRMGAHSASTEWLQGGYTWSGVWISSAISSLMATGFAS